MSPAASVHKAHERRRKRLPVQFLSCLMILAACSPHLTSPPTALPIPSATFPIPTPTSRIVALPTLTQTAPVPTSASPTPRARTDCKQRYSTLPAERDYWPTTEWRTATLAEHCLDPAKVERGVWYFEKGNYSGSLLIVRHGDLVYERYFRSYLKPEKTVPVMSVTKSVFSALFGIAMDQGLVDSLDHTVEEYFPEYFYPDIDPRMKQVTLRHLLTMSSGFLWDELGPIQQRWMATDNWVEAAIHLDFIEDPGTGFTYCTANTQILSGILTKLVGRPLKEYAQENLFTPLGIPAGHWSWGVDDHDYAIGGFGMQLRPRDMARFGYLYLNQGYWDGKQLISAKWVQESTRIQIKTGFGLGREYGYLWWIHPNTDPPVFEAQGSGGQTIYIVPSLDIVIIVTGNRSGVGAPENPSPLIYQYFLKAVTDA